MKATARQQGFIIPLLLILVVTTAVTILLTQLLGDSTETKHARQTTMALAQAKAALLVEAAIQQTWDKPSLFPCPDLPSSLKEGYSAGVCGSTNASSLGRFPWYSLQTGVLRDGDNECLWYAVSGYQKYFPQTNITLLNEDTPSMLQVLDASNQPLGGSNNADEIIAIVFAPATPVAGQNRSAIAGQHTQICGGNYTATNYLESISGVAVAPMVFAQAQPSAGYNDRMLTITRRELYAEIVRRKDFIDKITQLTVELGKCIGTAGAANIANIPGVANVQLGTTWNDYVAAGSYVSTSGLSGRFPASWVNAASCPNVHNDSQLSYLYKHWKDHFFYALSKAYAPVGGSGGCGTNDCVSVNGVNYAAIVLFSGLRLSAQNRKDLSLGDITQYLEGLNASNHPNTNGNSIYQKTGVVNSFNDILICIPTNLTQPAIVCP